MSSSEGPEVATTSGGVVWVGWWS
ncbi:hypothetical protein A2U01_0103378, partial [Trifolium medium]|nr:hypothetical protein [Trifolium medium]